MEERSQEVSGGTRRFSPAQPTSILGDRPPKRRRRRKVSVFDVGFDTESVLFHVAS